MNTHASLPNILINCRIEMAKILIQINIFAGDNCIIGPIISNSKLGDHFLEDNKPIIKPKPNEKTNKDAYLDQPAQISKGDDIQTNFVIRSNNSDYLTAQQTKVHPHAINLTFLKKSHHMNILNISFNYLGYEKVLTKQNLFSPELKS